MGWGRMLLLGNVGQQMDIDELKNYLDQAIAEINKSDQINQQQEQEIEQLKKDNRELKLYTLGLVRLLSSKGVLTDAEVQHLVSTIDNHG